MQKERKNIMNHVGSFMYKKFVVCDEVVSRQLSSYAFADSNCELEKSLWCR